MYEFIFSLISIAQGGFLLGFTGFLFVYYLPKKREDLKSDIRWHVILISISYFLLTLSTIIISITHLYDLDRFWYSIVSIGYILGDISLFFVFRHVARRNGNKKYLKGK